jgi:hypothetical protein
MYNNDRPYIDEFIDNMIMTLPSELITHVVQKYIYLPYNKLIIQRQKLLKSIVHRQLFFISNIIFIDNNICVYVNSNQLIIHNNSNNENNGISLYGLVQNISNIFTVYDNDINNINSSDNTNITNSTNSIHAHNTLLLDDISDRLNSIQNGLSNENNSNITIQDREFTNILQTNLSDMRNVVIDTNHSNMDNISIYIMYV